MMPRVCVVINIHLVLPVTEVTQCRRSVLRDHLTRLHVNSPAIIYTQTDKQNLTV